jgi:AmmeMemoRadiSam system protein A/AmmeMemoRadiSam system protein B
MSILAAFMVPHPPLIIPDVGRGGEKVVAKTIESYERVAKEIAAYKPDTIIISSPHATMYYDYFHISPGYAAEGDMGRFRASKIKFNEEYDAELVKEISRLAEKENIPAGTKGEREPELDHGTMVPLYFIRKYYKGGKIVRIGLSGLDYNTHFKLGKCIAKAVDNLGRRVVYVASGDLSHKLQESGPYGFIKEGPEYDEHLMDVCKRGNLKELLDFDETFCDKAAECGHRSFVIMAGVMEGLNYKTTVYSHEDTTGVGYGICSIIPADSASEAKPDPYVQLARDTIEAYIRNRKKIDIPDNTPKELLERRAGVFVSIHEMDNLRGCIGTIAATTDCIAEEIIQNAISASTRDPRFDPITEAELPLLDISVDVLGDAEEIDSPAQLDVKRYGVIVTKGFRRGLLLPDLEGVDTVEDQIYIAKRKAGIDPDEKVKLERFEVIRHH